MARFRAPSTISSSGSVDSQWTRSATPISRMPSIVEVSSKHPAPTTRARGPSRKVDKAKTHTRTTSKVNLRRRESIRMSKKKASVQTRPYSFVYVGNLSSHVTEEHLKEKFARFGPIRLIQIRASSGICVPTANLPRPFFGLGGRLEGIHYATVEFSSPTAARKALANNGVQFAGRNIIVSFSAIDLPETTEILKGLVEKKEQKDVPTQSLASLRTLWKRKFGQLKRLTIEKTEYISDPREAPAAPGQPVADLAKRISFFPDSSDTSTGRKHGHHMFTYPQTFA